MVLSEDEAVANFPWGLAIVDAMWVGDCVWELRACRLGRGHQSLSREGTPEFIDDIRALESARCRNRGLHSACRAVRHNLLLIQNRHSVASDTHAAGCRCTNLHPQPKPEATMEKAWSQSH